jgi:hypothetical protein
MADSSEVAVAATVCGYASCAQELERVRRPVMVVRPATRSCGLSRELEKKTWHEEEAWSEASSGSFRRCGGA